MKGVLRYSARRLLRPGSQRWYLVQSLLAALPRTRGGPSLQSRFYEATLPSCGPGLQLFGAVHLHRPEHIHLGARVILAEGVHITGHDNVVVGDDVAIGPYTVISSGDHRHGDLNIPIHAQGHDTTPVVIGSNVWIAAHCVVLRGARIASGAVIGAMSLVRGEVRSDTVSAGVSAQVRRQRGPNTDRIGPPRLEERS